MIKKTCPINNQMKTNILLSFFTLFVLVSFGQERPLLVFDLVNGTLDSTTIISYDTSILSDRTNYYLGNFNSNIEILEQIPPFSNVYPNSSFTIKKRASSDLDLTNYPIRTSVKLFRVENDTLKSNCSGSLISRKHVLTAAHCVSDINTNILKIDSMYVCPVFDNGNFSTNFNCSYVSKIYFQRDWYLSGDDFAVLELEEAIGESTGWISIGFNSMDSVFREGIFYKFSYPATTFIQIDSNQYNGDTLYYNYGNVDIINDNFIGIEYTSGIPGESGSSIIHIENEKTYTSYGVLTFSNNLRHSRLNNWKYFSIEAIIHNDLALHSNLDKNGEELTIYPNPTKGQFHLKDILINEIIKVTLFDKMGRRILDINNLDPYFIDISALSEGVYFLRVETSNSVVTKKVIKN